MTTKTKRREVNLTSFAFLDQSTLQNRMREVQNKKDQHSYSSKKNCSYLHNGKSWFKSFIFCLNCCNILLQLLTNLTAYKMTSLKVNTFLLYPQMEGHVQSIKGHRMVFLFCFQLVLHNPLYSSSLLERILCLRFED